MTKQHEVRATLILLGGDTMTYNVPPAVYEQLRTRVLSGSGDGFSFDTDDGQAVVLNPAALVGVSAPAEMAVWRLVVEHYDTDAALAVLDYLGMDSGGPVRLHVADDGKLEYRCSGLAVRSPAALREVADRAEAAGLPTAENLERIVL